MAEIIQSATPSPFKRWFFPWVKRWFFPWAQSANPYHTAAIAYAVYGAIYMAGAVIRLTPARQMSVFGLPWWSFYAVGAFILITFPVAIWLGYKWFTRIISFSPAIRTVALINGELDLIEAGKALDGYNCFFAAVSLWAAVHLFYASWTAHGFQKKRGDSKTT